MSKQLAIAKGKWLTEKLWRNELRRRQAFLLLSKTCPSCSEDDLSGRTEPDPRYSLPTPLPLALALLERDIQTYSQMSSPALKISIDPAHTFPEDAIVEPAILCAAVRFGAEYTLQRNKRQAILHITYQSSPGQFIQINTNTKAGDLWFVLEPGSAAEVTKLNLVRALNHFIARGGVFEAVETTRGNMSLRVWTKQAPKENEKIWREVDQTLGERAQRISYADHSDGASAVWMTDNTVYKAQIFGKSSDKALALAEEYQILQRLRGSKEFLRWSTIRSRRATRYSPITG